MRRMCVLGLAWFLLLNNVSIAQEATPAPELIMPPAADGKSSLAHAPSVSDEAWHGCATPAYPRVWGGAEALLWWVKNSPVNTPLLTLATNPADPKSGAIGSANTVVLLGNQSYDIGARFGGRFTLGGWLDSEGTIGLEASYMLLSPRSTSQTFGTSGLAASPSLAVPFFNPLTGTETSAGLAGPGLPGAATLRVANELQSAELNLVGNFLRRDNFTLSGLVGFRYLRFKEELDFGLENSALGAGHLFRSRDDFAGTNNFYGGQIGLRGEYQLGKFFVEATGKLGLGAMDQAVDVGGVSTAVNVGAPPGFNFVNAPGGSFAQPTNFGHHTRTEFDVLPEFDLKLGYNVTRNIQAFVGYNFLYLNNVVRPGAVIDHSINPSQVPALTPAPFALVGPAAPSFSFSRSDFWAQGMMFGMEVKY